MKTYLIHIEVRQYFAVEVEAKNEEEARKAALNTGQDKQELVDSELVGIADVEEV